MTDWPETVGLSVGESLDRTYTSGTWTLTLDSYSVVINLQHVTVTFTVTGPNSYSKQVTTRCSMGQAPVVVGGLRVYPFAWKEADDPGGLEQAGQQGSLPAGLNNGSNDIAFLINDAADYMFPVGDYWLDQEEWTGEHWQCFLELNTTEAHSGLDAPLPGGSWFVAPWDGWVYPESTQCTYIPDLPINTSHTLFSETLSFIITHAVGSSSPFGSGDAVSQGDLIIQSNTVDRHFHIGGKGHLAGGAWVLDYFLWNHNAGASWQGPRWWLLGSAIPNTQADTLSYPGDPGTGTVTRLTDGLTRGVLPLHKTLPSVQFSDPATKGSAAYSGTWVWSPSAQSATLKLGATRKARVWVNGSVVTNLDNSSRYANVNANTTALLVHDEQTTMGISLNAGWNSLMVASDDTNGSNRTWVYSLKLEGASQQCGFYTRSMSASSNGTTLSWSNPSHHNLAYDGVKVQVSTSRVFTTANEYDAGSGTSVALSSLSLTSGVTNYARVVPYNTAGELLTDVADIVEISPGGDITIPPSQSSPIATSDTPMFVLFGSDDNNRAGGVRAWRDAFGGRFNPDGSPARMSFYLIGEDIYGPNINATEWRDEYMGAYMDGHELGNHGFYGTVQEGGGLPATAQDWIDTWMQPTHDYLMTMFQAYGYTLAQATAAVKGYRFTQDQINQYGPDAVKSLGYLYENSSTTNHSTNLPAWFPGTIENGWPGGATWDNRDFGDTTGIMEIPQTYADGTSWYCDKDWFDNGDTNADQWLIDMKATFQTLYNGNRAPMSLCIHSQEWGPTNVGGSNGYPARVANLTAFLDFLLSGAFPDVRIVTHRQMYDWMLAPIPLNSEPSSGQTITMSAPVSITVSAPTGGSASISGAPDAIVTADVSTIESTRPDTFFMGAASVWVWVAVGTGATYLGPANDALFIQGLKAVNYDVLRWGGGNWTNRIGWERDSVHYEGYTWDYVDTDVNSLTYNETFTYGHIYNGKMMDNLGTLCSSVPGLTIMLEINVKDNNPDMWLDLLRYCVAEGRNIPIEYVEIGNEQDLGGQRTWGDGSHLVNAQEYSRRWVRYQQALSVINAERDAGMPEVKFGGPVVANPAQGGVTEFGTWWPTFKTYCDNAGITPDFLSWHYYPSSFTNNPSTDIDRSNAAAAAMTWNTFLSSNGSSWTAGDTVGDTHYMMVLKRKFSELQVDGIDAEIPGWESIPKFITENRPWSGNADEIPHGKAVNATWFLDITQRMMRKGVDGIMWYTFRETNERAGALDVSRVHVPFYGPYLLAQLTGKYNLATTVSREGFPGWATKTATGDVVFTVGDDSGADSTTVRLQVSGAAPGEYTTATVYKLNADPDYDTDLGLNSGAAVDINGTYQFSPSTGSTVESKVQALFDSGVTVNLPSTGIYDLTLDQAWQQAVVVYGLGAPVSTQTLFMSSPVSIAVSAPSGGSIASVIVSNQTLTMSAAASIEISAPAGTIAAPALDVKGAVESTGGTVTFAETPTDGDMLLIAAHQNTSDGASVPAFTWPAGFTELRQVDGSAIAWKEASGESGASYTVTSSIAASDVSATVDASTDDAIDHTPGYLGFNATNAALFTGNSSGTAIRTGLRFTGISIPAGATITDARITLKKYDWAGGEHTVTIACEDSASPGTFTSGTRPKLRTMTTAQLTGEAVTRPNPESTWQSSSFHASVQELVDSYGALTEIVVLIDGEATGNYGQWYAYDLDPTKTAQLDISLQAQEMNVHGLRIQKGNVEWTILDHSGATSDDTSEATPSINSAGVDDFVAWGTAVSESNANAWTGSNAFSGTASGGSDTEGGDVRSQTQSDSKIKSTSAYRVFTGAGSVIYTSKTTDSSRVSALAVLVTDTPTNTLVMSSPASIEISAPSGTIFHTNGLRMNAPVGITIVVGGAADYNAASAYNVAAGYSQGIAQPVIANADAQALTMSAPVSISVSAPAATMGQTSNQTLTMSAAESITVTVNAGTIYLTQNLNSQGAVSIAISAPAATIANESAQALTMSAAASIEVSAPAGTMRKITERRGNYGRGGYNREIHGHGRV